MLPFIFKVVAISSSGALAPGPLTAATAAIGTKQGWRGGFWISVGHAIVELLLILLIASGIAAILTQPNAVTALSIAGGLILVFFGILTAKSTFDVFDVKSSKRSTSNPFSTGLLLSALNPFFITWWIGVGAVLISEAISLWGYAGIAVLYLSHVWLDFAWLILLSHLTSLTIFSTKIYRVLLFVLSVLVLLFGIDFLNFGMFGTHLLPF